MKMKKFFSLVLASVMVLSTSVVTAFAENTEEFTTTGSAEVPVIVDVESSFTVTIPKSITVDGSTGLTNYQIKVSGDIKFNEYIKVAPNSSQIRLSTVGKESMNASVYQRDNSVYSADLTDEVILEGSITANNLTAGTWEGSLSFDISLVERQLGAGGLFDVRGTKVKDWAEFSDPSISQTPMHNQNTTLNSLGVKEIILGDTMTVIGSYAFSGCSSLTKITLSPYTTNIGSYAFSACTGVEYITVPKTVKSVGNMAFNRVKLVIYDGDLDTSNWGAVSVINPNNVNDKVLGSADSNYLSINGSICTVKEDYLDEYTVNMSGVPVKFKVTGIGSTVNCTSAVNTILVPSPITFYSMGAFKGAASNCKVYLPTSITNIEITASAYNSYEVHYAGTEDQWNAITFEEGSGKTKADINVVFNSPYVSN